MQDVVAGDPVQRTAVPVLPQRDGVVWGGEPIAESGDDEAAILGNQRTGQVHHRVRRPPIVERRLRGDQWDVGDDGFKPAASPRNRGSHRGWDAVRRRGANADLDAGGH